MAQTAAIDKRMEEIYCRSSIRVLGSSVQYVLLGVVQDIAVTREIVFL